MPRSFSPAGLKEALNAHTRDPQHAVRLALGVLLAANLVAAWFVFRTPGGSLEELESDMAAKRNQLVTRQKSLESIKKLTAKADMAREAGDLFLGGYFLPRRHAYSMLEVDLANSARTANIRAKERTYSYEPIEGSDTLGMLNINANFEGTYADLITLVNSIDRSKRLLIIEQLQAQPQQGSNTLAITLKLNAFFRLDGPEASEKDLGLLQAADNPAPPPAQAVKETPKPPPAQPVVQPKPGVQPPPQPQAAEPRSGPYPAPPKTRTFRRPQRTEEEQ
jgi:hypothetical protein